MTSPVKINPYPPCTTAQRDANLLGINGSVFNLDTLQVESTTDQGASWAYIPQVNLVVLTSSIAIDPTLAYSVIVSDDLGDYDVNLMPADNFPLGQQITVMRKFNQQVNVSADGAVSINGEFGRTIKMTSPYQCTVLIKVGADDWQTLWPLYNPGSGVTIAAGNNNESSISSP